MAWSLTARGVPSLQEKEYGMGNVPQPPAKASWQKSNASGDKDEECVEMVGTQWYVWVRDSKNPLGPTLGFSRDAWSVFLVGVQCDEFDHSRVPA